MTYSGRRQPGFTLIELMVTVAVIAVIAAIAFPSYQEQVRKTRRADAQAGLMELSNYMERLFTENGNYNVDVDGDGTVMRGDEADDLVFNQTPKDGSAKAYNITFPAAADITATAFKLRATPIGGQAGDGILEISSTGARSWDKNNDGDTADAGENSWNR